MISAASWADETVNFNMKYDWKTLGIDPSKAVLVAPYIKDFQEERTFKVNEPIPVEPKKGWLLYIEGKAD